MQKEYMTMDPYKILGVSPKATDKEITKVYRSLAKKYHPDLNGNSQIAANKMAQINEAYDEIKRLRSIDSYNRADPSSGLSPLDSVEAYLKNNMYEQALYILNNINNRTARWYYLAAIANSYAGNAVTAREYAKKARDMEPENKKYRVLEDHIKTGETTYFDRRGYKAPISGFARVFLIFGILYVCLCRRCMCC